MFISTFPDLSQWHSEQENETRRQQYLEYRYGVDYHLALAERAQQACSSSLWNIGWHPIRDRKAVYLRLDVANQVIQQGDTAIRESVSALDSALVLINHVLGLGVEKTRVTWGQTKKKEQLRKSMRRPRDADYSKLEIMLDETYSSKGLKMLKGYRGWVTHRGAPCLSMPASFNEPLEIPESALEPLSDPKGVVDTEQWLAHRIQTFLSVHVPEQLKVTCWPFVSPVQSVYSGVF